MRPALWFLAAATPGWACSVCNADPKSATANAANMAVITMLICIGCVLAGMSYVAYTWIKRAEALELAAGRPRTSR